MKQLEPEFIRNFRCTASACTDTCCAGWEVELDEEAAQYYRQVPGSFGDRLRTHMRTDGDETYFALTESRRCPFLNERNLCDVYTKLGEGALCDICTEHPRFYSWFGDYTEKGLGLCCEEAERLLFLQKKPLRFVLRDDGSETKESEDPWIGQLLRIRKQAFSILQDRTVCIKERLERCHVFFEEIQYLLDTGKWPENGPEEAVLSGLAGGASDYVRKKSTSPDVERQREYAADLLAFFGKLECLDVRWQKRLQTAAGLLSEIVTKGAESLAGQKEREYEWEHLAVYLLYRYLPEAVWDMDVLTRMDFVLVSLILLGLLAGSDAVTCAEGYTEAERDALVRMFSREIEYCPENMEAIYEALRTGELTVPKPG